MKKHVIAFVMALLLLPSVVMAQKEGAKFSVYGVAFYNLENLFDTIPNNPLGRDLEFTPGGQNSWGSKKYWSKIHNLAYAISQMTTQTTPGGPAIIGVSEIENRSVLEDLVRDPAIKQWMLQVVHHDSPDRRGVDVGLLYNPRQYRVLNVTNHTLSIPSNPSFRTRDQMCVTGVLACGDTLSVIVNHWPSRLGGQEQSSYLREAAAELSKHIADSLWAIRPNQGVVIMGDLNDDPQDKSCAKILGAKKNESGVGEHGFYNPWWKMLDKGIGTLAYKGAWNLFDQIIVGGTLLKDNARPGAAYYWKCQVNNYDFLIDQNGTRQGYPKRTHAAGVWLNGYSDHFPTEIFIVKRH
ncbi:MAG: endonuclease/exonuclease/phosphatase family protein [Firmicutes bacterium]|nr:endonuclease/exonuclease/phosphatase family protein [Bacillota bacterium]MCM1401082.1 endonuclease/exonuclease/phosphatase family protein [Bacteroides sp.]MCM1477001.1 endonuclease/exonuclease/phosphatase family protein [Bacteroides sp.]